MRSIRPFYLFLVLAAWNLPAAAAPIEISEFMAGGQHVLADEDDEFPDWIELHNLTRITVSLKDWQLSDNPRQPAKWRFPETNLVGGGFLLVFASEKNRTTPGEPLHTNFKLTARGEYLGLRDPEGNVVTEFSPRYPIQVPGIAFGSGDGSNTRQWVGPGSRLRFWVPEDGKLGLGWVQPDFNDSTWRRGQNGVGFEQSPGTFARLIRTEVENLMQGRLTSCYLRIPFVVTNLTEVVQPSLQVQYDDGFVAWINGVEVARANAPTPARWNSSASAVHADAKAIQPEVFDLIDRNPKWVVGTNWLAVQALNAGKESSDLLLMISLESILHSTTNRSIPAHYLLTPSPGKSNPGGVARPGPLIQSLAEFPRLPAQPADGDDIRIDAQVLPLNEPVSEVVLHYRIMFEPEVAVPMIIAERPREEARGAAGGTQNSESDSPGNQEQMASVFYRGVIPASASKPGDLVRYFVTARDHAGRMSRWPLYVDRRDSSAYLGTVVSDPGVSSKLPILQIFTPPDRNADDLENGFFGVFYSGEYYDNVRFRHHGQISRHFPKQSFNLDFPRDHRLRYLAKSTRVKDIKILANYADKSKIRNTLAYEFIAASGSLGHFAFPVRIQCNGKFYSVAEMVEDGDDRWLTRMGRDPNGALYKIYDNLSNARGAEKKTRKGEDHSDLEHLIRALDESRPLAQRAAWAYDHLDLPQTLSYLVAMALISSDDHGHKNYYMYCDSRGSGEWAILPWDVDLSWGRNWTGQYFDEDIYADNPIDLYRFGRRKPHNRLYSLIFENPEFRQMYLRRLRTVMDTVLLPPGTPPQQLRIEPRVRELIDTIDPRGAGPSDATLDNKRWPSWGERTTARAQAEQILNEYLPGRRQFLFENRRANLAGERIPGAQPNNVSLQIRSFEIKPVSGDLAEQFVAISNTNDFAVDVSGWSLQGAGIRHTFRPGTVIPARKDLLVSPDVAAFRLRKTGPRGGQSLLVQGDFHGYLGAGNQPLALSDPSGRVVAERKIEANEAGGG